MGWQPGDEPSPGGTPDPAEPLRALLAAFEKGGAWDAAAPSAALALALETAAGPDGLYDGADAAALVGIARQWAAIESWAGAGLMGAVRAMMREDHEGTPLLRRQLDLPDGWDDNLLYQLAAALAMGPVSAGNLAGLAWALLQRLPGTGRLLSDGTLTKAKARLIVQTFEPLTEDEAARAEALILGDLPGKTWPQVERLAWRAALAVAPDIAERRRKAAERHRARVTLFREQSGAAGLSGRDLPTAEALAGHANIMARAKLYEDCGAFPGRHLGALQALAYTHLLRGVTAEDAIAYARTDNPEPLPSTTRHDGQDEDDDPFGPLGTPARAPGTGGDDSHDHDSDDDDDERPDRDDDDPGGDDPGDDDPGDDDDGPDDDGPDDAGPDDDDGPDDDGGGDRGGPGDPGAGGNPGDDHDPRAGGNPADDGPREDDSPGGGGPGGPAGPAGRGGHDEDPAAQPGNSADILGKRPDNERPDGNHRDPGRRDPGDVGDPGRSDPGLDGNPTDDSDSDSRDPDSRDPDGGSGLEDSDIGDGDAEARPVLPEVTAPLATLQRQAERPGETRLLGPIDPALTRDLAAAATRSPHARWEITIVDERGYAIGHGTARPRRGKRQPPQPPPHPASRALPARVNITITQTRFRQLAEQAAQPRPGAPPDDWQLAPRTTGANANGNGNAEDGPWELTLPDGRELTVRFDAVPTHDCDHRFEVNRYRPSERLKRLVQIRDYECTFPPCSRPAHDSDFEHAIPYDQGGRTDACNAGARSRRCHQVKQLPGWTVTQPKPGWHVWTTPTGRTYTQEPWRYTA